MAVGAESQSGRPATAQGRGAATGSSGSAGSDEFRIVSPAVIRAEPRLNAVIVRDQPERMPMYEQVIASLDQPSALVEVEATVIDVVTDNARTLGVDWRAHAKKVDIVSSPSGLTDAAVSPRPGNDLLYSDNPLSSGPAGLVGTLIFGSQRSYFLARIYALAERGDANLVSRPRVLTLNNNEAVLQSTTEFFVRVQGKDTVDLYNVNAGLVLRVTPTLVEEEGKRQFKLLVRIEDGSPSGTRKVDEIPLVSRNSIVTQAVIGEDESLLIGGYVIDETRNDQASVPGLANIPMIGWLFRTDSRSTRRVERMFLITPRLVVRGESRE